MKHRPDDELPRTLEAAVSILLAGLSNQGRTAVESTPESDLIRRFHHGWGTGIRNAFGLWAGNRALLDSCCALGTYGPHPDEASSVIIKGVWNRLHGLPQQNTSAPPLGSLQVHIL